MDRGGFAVEIARGDGELSASSDWLSALGVKKLLDVTRARGCFVRRTVDELTTSCRMALVLRRWPIPSLLPLSSPDGDTFSASWRRPCLGDGGALIIPRAGALLVSTLKSYLDVKPSRNMFALAVWLFWWCFRGSCDLRSCYVGFVKE